MGYITRFFNNPFPIRSAIKAVIRKSRLGNYAFRYGIGAVERPHYAYMVYHAALLAKRLGEPAVSIVEFGVAGGNGLVALERHAEEVERLFGVKIELYGFDTSAGLPPPTDFRDLPYHWKPGFFKMDEAALRQRLTRSKLVIGDVADTVKTFFKDFNPAPIGAVSHDLDYYSSTMNGLGLFDGPAERFLPRVVCYFDDTMGSEMELYTDFSGERLAIHDFNKDHELRKLSPIYYLAGSPIPAGWHHQMWSFHLFDHPRYNAFVSDENQQLPLAGE